MKRVDKQKLAKILGRHTRLSVPFSWTIGGDTVDLQADNYTVRVWVQGVDGTTVSGPHSTTVEGETATYHMDASDLEEPSEGPMATVELVAVAENGTNTLVSDARQIAVGDWGGAETYTPE